MGEFFKGWRRKTGCIMLAMAMAVMVLWVRSSVVSEWIDWDDVVLMSCDEGVYARTPRKLNLWPSTCRWIVTEESETAEECVAHPSWSRRFGGFRYSADSGPFRRDSALIPYWSLIAPLVLFSAYLLLVKPRPRTLTRSLANSDEGVP